MIRLAKHEDLDTLLCIYAIARKYMADNGNPTQWPPSYPSREMLKQDIQKQQLFVLAENDVIHGVFVFTMGPEKVYAYIEDGGWKNEVPYGAIHRIASDGTIKGMFRQCMDFCKQKIANLRIDTHKDNQPMQHLLEKNGFERCGIIYVEDGTPRIAYQYIE